MIFNWNPDTIRWYREANDYTGFFKKIAALIAPRIKGYTTFCDIGCGLGLIDLELSRHIEQITCIDINEATIEALKQSLKERHITNITPHVMDSDTIQANWDIIYLCFYGSSNLERFLPHCRKLIAIVGGHNQTGLYPEKYRVYQKNTVDKAKQNFEAKGIAYTLSEMTLEFGQPLVSLEDAKNFVMSHSSEISPHDLNEFVAERVIETPDKRYPLYMPHQKSIGIFEIEGKG